MGTLYLRKQSEASAEAAKFLLVHKIRLLYFYDLFMVEVV